MKLHLTRGLLVSTALAAGLGAAQAQDATAEAIAKYREMLQDGNPAELYEMKGEELWKQKRGPKNVSLEQCDLGKGPGVIKGAFVELPRFFKDTGRVQDLESRLVTCMETLQGFDGGSGQGRLLKTAGARLARDSRIMRRFRSQASSYSNGHAQGLKTAGARLARGETAQRLRIRRARDSRREPRALLARDPNADVHGRPRRWWGRRVLGRNLRGRPRDPLRGLCSRRSVPAHAGLPRILGGNTADRHPARLVAGDAK